VLGRDLAVTPYRVVPGSVPLYVADSWGSVDLAARPGGQGGLRLSVKGDIRDFGVVDGRANLAQALILRLVTQQGSLAALGHPQYGSRLIELIGRGNTETVRNLARLFTLQVLKQEPRVAQVLDLVVDTMAGQPDTVRIRFSVLPLDDDQPLGLALVLKP
jgi:phage baseplate assembly protein W